MNDCINACFGDTNCIFNCVEIYDNEKQKCPCGKKCPLGCPCEDCDDCFQCEEDKCVDLEKNQDLKEVWRHLTKIVSFYIEFLSLPRRPPQFTIRTIPFRHPKSLISTHSLIQHTPHFNTTLSFTTRSVQHTPRFNIKNPQVQHTKGFWC